MRTGTPEMVEDLVFGTASILKSISQHGEAVVVQRAARQQPPCIGRNRQRDDGGRSPSWVEADGAKGIEDFAEKVSLEMRFGGSFSLLPCGIGRVVSSPYGGEIGIAGEGICRSSRGGPTPLS